MDLDDKESRKIKHFLNKKEVKNTFLKIEK